MIYDVIYLFDVVAVLASSIVCDRGVQPAARGPNAIQQSGTFMPVTSTRQPV